MSYANEGSFLKIIENGQMKLIKLSSEQIDKMYQTITMFMGLLPEYKYKEFENADIDNTLLLCISDEADPHRIEYRYHNWQNTTPVPKGVELLLRFFDKIIKPE